MHGTVVHITLTPIGESEEKLNKWDIKVHWPHEAELTRLWLTIKLQNSGLQSAFEEAGQVRYVEQKEDSAYVRMDTPELAQKVLVLLDNNSGIPACRSLITTINRPLLLSQLIR